MKQRVLSVIKRVPKLVFLAIAFIAVGSVIVKKVHQYNREGSALMQELFEMNTLLSDKETWDSRARWVEQRIPRFDTQNGASHFLLHNLEESSAAHGVSIKEHYIHPRKKDLVISAETFRKFDRATVDLSIKGTEQDIVTWIHSIQKPGKFIGVNNVVLELGDYGLQCQLQVSQWYLGNNRSLDPFQHHEPEVHDLGPSLVHRF